MNLQSESTVEAKNGNLEYNLTITNTGFATVINPKEVYLVLVSGDGQVAKEIKLDVDPKTWIPSTNEEPNQVAKYVIKEVQLRIERDIQSWNLDAGESGRFEIQSGLRHQVCSDGETHSLV